MDSANRIVLFGINNSNIGNSNENKKALVIKKWRLLYDNLLAVNISKNKPKKEEIDNINPTYAVSCTFLSMVTGAIYAIIPSARVIKKITKENTTSEVNIEDRAGLIILIE